MVNVWTDPPADPNSQLMIARLAIEGVALRSSIQYGEARAIFVVGPDQPRVPVRLINQADPAMREMLAEGVPIPDGAWKVIHARPDRSLIVMQGDVEWELWQATQAPDGSWSCKNAGCTLSYSADVGFFNPTSWRSQDGRFHSSFGWGHRSCSLNLRRGLLTRAAIAAAMDAEKPLPEALALQVPWTRAGVWAWPAQRCDGRDPSENALPEGAKLRLPSWFDVDSIGSAAGRMLARTVQAHGAYVVDQTADAVGFDCGEVYDLTADPSMPPLPLWRDLLAADTASLMARFPWKYGYIERMDLRSRAGW
jgi:hypothetical protein